MRAKHWFLGIAAACVVAGLIAGGCGGSSSENAPEDAGVDVTAPVDAYVVPDVGVDAHDASTGVDACMVDADLNTIDIPDAEIGDSGYTTDDCIACARAKCGALVLACNADCSCKSALIAFYDCIRAPGGSLSTCSAPLFAAGGNAISLGSCVAISPECTKACGIPPAKDGGKDGAANDAAPPSDAAPTDAAPSDAAPVDATGE
jgi:hypothetical protein